MYCTGVKKPTQKCSMRLILLKSQNACKLCIIYSSFKTQTMGYSMPYVIKVFHYIQPNKHVNPSNVN